MYDKKQRIFRYLTNERSIGVLRSSEINLEVVEKGGVV